ncbi:uncharacterized protein LOC9651512 [Selaginella moellendorffii]|uniref:CLAVATA3/endosperm surrounding region 14 n=1 Tax=Selaginella moellendorffii TaxID=88036 RepID=C0STP2_SELML|nr:uncharacterized protein LOC9651512 [Selaginella moellendorffii]BAH56545.1 CLAVATA3/endosperm surrounding region 14 [Selaginella moellendorffii]|eukprot:XP_024533083.1 uncharacterized protein LOC9651512 [Selaginella moellendorffii]
MRSSPAVMSINPESPAEISSLPCYFSLRLLDSISCSLCQASRIKVTDQLSSAPPGLALKTFRFLFQHHAELLVHFQPPVLFQSRAPIHPGRNFQYFLQSSGARLEVFTMRSWKKVAAFMLLLCCFYVFQPTQVSCARIPVQGKHSFLFSFAADPSQNRPFVPRFDSDENQAKVAVASESPVHHFLRCKEGSSSCGSDFQAEKLHSVPSGPNPVGNSLPGKFLVTRRSPPPFPEGIPHP